MRVNPHLLMIHIGPGGQNMTTSSIYIYIYIIYNYSLIEAARLHIQIYLTLWVIMSRNSWIRSDVSSFRFFFPSSASALTSRSNSKHSLAVNEVKQHQKCRTQMWYRDGMYRMAHAQSFNLCGTCFLGHLLQIHVSLKTQKSKCCQRTARLAEPPNLQQIGGRPSPSHAATRRFCIANTLSFWYLSMSFSKVSSIFLFLPSNISWNSKVLVDHWNYFSIFLLLKNKRIEHCLHRDSLLVFSI